MQVMGKTACVFSGRRVFVSVLLCMLMMHGFERPVCPWFSFSSAWLVATQRVCDFADEGGFQWSQFQDTFRTELPGDVAHSFLTGALRDLCQGLPEALQRRRECVQQLATSLLVGYP
jgi:hypothetical protein